MLGVLVLMLGVLQGCHRLPKNASFTLTANIYGSRDDKVFSEVAWSGIQEVLGTTPGATYPDALPFHITLQEACGRHYLRLKEQLNPLGYWVLFRADTFHDSDSDDTIRNVCRTRGVVVAGRGNQLAAEASMVAVAPPTQDNRAEENVVLCGRDARTTETWTCTTHLSPDRSIAAAEVPEVLQIIRYDLPNDIGQARPSVVLTGDFNLDLDDRVTVDGATATGEDFLAKVFFAGYVEGMRETATLDQTPTFTDGRRIDYIWMDSFNYRTHLPYRLTAPSHLISEPGAYCTAGQWHRDCWSDHIAYEAWQVAAP